MVLEERINRIVSVFRGEGMETSDHPLMVAKMRCLRRWIGREVRMEERFKINQG